MTSIHSLLAVEDLGYDRGDKNKDILYKVGQLTVSSMQLFSFKLFNPFICFSKHNVVLLLVIKTTMTLYSGLVSEGTGMSALQGR